MEQTDTEPVINLEIAPSDERAALWKEDMITAGCASLLVLGLFLDGWNHINLQNGALGSFFTPWHGLLYLGFTLTAAWVLTRNPHLYQRNVDPKKEFYPLFGLHLRYPFAIVGITIATVGVVGDAIWHTVFGTETGVSRVIAPFHILLFAGGTLLIAAPFRSGWNAPRHYPADSSFKQLLPPLLSLTLVTAVTAFLFQWLSAFINWQPSLEIGRLPAGLGSFPPVEGTVEFSGVARIVVTNLVLMGPVFLALRRWRLPFWSVTFLFTTVAVTMSALTEFDRAGAIVAAAAGGLTADALIRWLRPSPRRAIDYRVIAGAVPIVMWSVYFLMLRAAYGIWWPFDLWLGTVGVCAFTSIGLSYLAVGPAVPGGAWTAEEGG